MTKLWKRWMAFSPLSGIGVSLMAVVMFLLGRSLWRIAAGGGFALMAASIWVGLCATIRRHLSVLTLKAACAVGAALAATGAAGSLVSTMRGTDPEIRDGSEHAV